MEDDVNHEMDPDGAKHGLPHFPCSGGLRTG